MIWKNTVFTQHVTYSMFCQLFICFCVSFQELKKNLKSSLKKSHHIQQIISLKGVLWTSCQNNCSSFQSGITKKNFTRTCFPIDYNIYFIGLLWLSWLLSLMYCPLHCSSPRQGQGYGHILISFPVYED